MNPRQQCDDAIKSVLALEKSNFIKEINLLYRLIYTGTESKSQGKNPAVPSHKQRIKELALGALTLVHKAVRALRSTATTDS